MKIGFLHLGDGRHGVSRYGRLLSNAAREREDVEVLESAVRLTADPAECARRVKRAARGLSAADVVHIQFNSQAKHSVWGSGWEQVRNLAAFFRACERPVVATLHDLPETSALWPFAARVAKRLRYELTSGLRSWRRELLRPEPTDDPAPGGVGSGALVRSATLHYLTSRLRGGFVCSEDERRRLRGIPGASRVEVIPHFVETRRISTDREQAKTRLGLRDARVLTLLGYLHPRKGWRVLLEALELLPPDIVLVLAGTGSTSDDTLGAIAAVAEERQLAERLRLPGYLPEAELELYLAATDLAVCPFESVSASGSVSTWISVPRRILASDLPLFAEYNRIVPASIDVFAPRSPTVLAERIIECLVAADAKHERLARLRDRLALPSIVDAHIEAYRRHASGSRPLRTSRPADLVPAG